MLFSIPVLGAGDAIHGRAQSIQPHEGGGYPRGYEDKGNMIAG